MHALFEKHTGWTDAECFYVVAFKGYRRAWLAGPYATRSLAEDVLPQAMQWAIRDSGDTQAVNYQYRVAQHHHGHDRSILGEIQP
jgi:hypothetical protein